MAISVDSLLASSKASADAMATKNLPTVEELQKAAIKQQLDFATAFDDMQKKSAQAYAAQAQLEKLMNLSGLFQQQQSSGFSIPGVTQ